MIVAAEPWDSPDGVSLRAEQRHELEERYGTPDLEPGVQPTAKSVALFVVARVDGEAVGCGALRRIDDSHGEIKRMFVAPAHRGTGTADRILAALEQAAMGFGWDRLVLETGAPQPDAIRFYERAGYRPIPAWGDYVDSADSLCFGKTLAPAPVTPAGTCAQQENRAVSRTVHGVSLSWRPDLPAERRESR